MIFISRRLNVGSFYTDFCKFLNKFYHLFMDLSQPNVCRRTGDLGYTLIWWRKPCHLFGEIEGLTFKLFP